MGLTQQMYGFQSRSRSRDILLSRNISSKMVESFIQPSEANFKISNVASVSQLRLKANSVCRTFRDDKYYKTPSKKPSKHVEEPVTPTYEVNIIKHRKNSRSKTPTKIQKPLTKKTEVQNNEYLVSECINSQEYTDSHDDLGISNLKSETEKSTLQIINSIPEPLPNNRGIQIVDQLESSSKLREVDRKLKKSQRRQRSLSQ